MRKETAKWIFKMLLAGLAAFALLCAVCAFYFNVRNAEARVILRSQAAHFKAMRTAYKSAVGFVRRRIGWDQNDLIKTDRIHAVLSQFDMTFMNRVKCTAQNSDLSHNAPALRLTAACVYSYLRFFSSAAGL